MTSKPKSYDPKKIEKKWQTSWAKKKLYKTPSKAGKKKCYVLDMFPYPSGDGLHVGHPKGYIATDVYSRRKRMEGYSVLHPMGWDAFGLPAENYAIKNKVHPRKAVEKNVKRFKEQLSKIGFDYDWAREVNTTDPEYYRWTQWIFLKLYEAGLAFESYEPINWCPSCQTGLANEDLEDGKCERCGSVVEKKPIRQWVLKITKYADRLLKDLDLLEWPESIKQSQREWIGRSVGAELQFKIKNQPHSVTVFTTRPDTLFGATYLVLAPEHPLVAHLAEEIENRDEVENYARSAKNLSEIERTAEGKEKSGVVLKGITAINPGTFEEIPVFVADYVLGHYGTGAIMAVPAHDTRDYQFAKKYSLPIKVVIAPFEQGKLFAGIPEVESLPQAEVEARTQKYIELKGPYQGDGFLINSAEFNGKNSKEVGLEVAEFAEGKAAVQYKLRDWVFARQRYWGEPIPLVYCWHCAEKIKAKQYARNEYTKGELMNPGWIMVPEKQLPVKLPEVKSYEPTGTGESPLANITKWVETTCPKCKGLAKRETNTMPQWAGSSWYYLRFADPANKKALIDKKTEKAWLPVDVYVGGTEHATRHLIYARFWHKFLYDIGAVASKEPFMRLQSLGVVLAEDGRKMSKRWGNVINPDDVIASYGADTMRMYEMFMGPFENAIAWNTESMVGVRRFLERVWRLQYKLAPKKAKLQIPEGLESLLHKTIKKVGEDIENFKFNTAVSALMILLNDLEKETEISRDHYKAVLQLLAPFAPHMTEELWGALGERGSVHVSQWPVWNPKKLKTSEVTIAIQINGKTRDTIQLPEGAEQAEALARALEREMVKKRLEGREIKRVIYVPGKLLSLVS